MSATIVVLYVLFTGEAPIELASVRALSVCQEIAKSLNATQGKPDMQFGCRTRKLEQRS